MTVLSLIVAAVVCGTTCCTERTNPLFAESARRR